MRSRGDPMYKYVSLWMSARVSASSVTCQIRVSEWACERASEGARVPVRVGSFIFFVPCLYVPNRFRRSVYFCLIRARGVLPQRGGRGRTQHRSHRAAARNSVECGLGG